jgi:Sec-independent protein translocase protein TatA
LLLERETVQLEFSWLGPSAERIPRKLTGTWRTLENLKRAWNEDRDAESKDEKRKEENPEKMAKQRRRTQAVQKEKEDEEEKKTRSPA